MHQPTSISRRSAIFEMGAGLGLIALSDLMGQTQLAADQSPATKSRVVPKVRRIVQFVMNGGVSQMDTFDFKPELLRKHGQAVDFGIKAAATSIPGPIMKCPFEWNQYGESGRWVSSVLPNMANIVDDLAFFMAMSSKTNVHGPASYLQTTGFLTPGFPCAGSWVSYGLGRLTDNLPTFVVLPDSRGLPYNNAGNFSAGFLPMVHQGVIIRPNSPHPIPHLQPPSFATFVNDTSESATLSLLSQLNRSHEATHPGDSRLGSRIAAYELAAKMQLSAPDVLNVSSETQAMHQAYGLDQKATADFGRNCLIARRLLERGVRYVQVWSGAGGASNNWDNHSDIPKELPSIAASVDQPITAMVTDLKRRGMFDDTLVIWTTEFGRMPFTQGSTGRDHNGGTFVTWFAGAGIRGGVSFGESDEFSYRAVQNVTNCYDMHATMLWLMGIDHERLTVRHNGIDRRLTDVHGRVIHEILT